MSVNNVKGAEVAPVELVPCPICGSEPKVVRASEGDWWVECEQRSHYLCTSVSKRDKVQAIDEWARVFGPFNRHRRPK